MGFHRQITPYTSILSLAIFYIASLFHLAYKAIFLMKTAFSYLKETFHFDFEGAILFNEISCFTPEDDNSFK